MWIRSSEAKPGMIFVDADEYGDDGPLEIGDVREADEDPNMIAIWLINGRSGFDMIMRPDEMIKVLTVN